MRISIFYVEFFSEVLGKWVRNERSRRSRTVAEMDVAEGIYPANRYRIVEVSV